MPPTDTTPEATLNAPAHPVTTLLEIDVLIVDPKVQSRDQFVDKPTAEDYAEDMKKGDVFPAIDVYLDDGDRYWLSRGFQRVAAAKLAGYGSITANVRRGSREDAILHAAGDNADHGLRRTRADKRHAVRNVFMTGRGKTMSDREIADIAHVSPGLVKEVRDELARTDNSYSQTVRTGRDGRTINTANIGSKPADPTPRVAPRGPGLWRLRSEIEDLLDLTWPKLFKAVQRRTQAASPYLLIRTSRGHVAILDAAKAIAEQTGEATLHTEYGEALFFDHHDPQQLRTGIESHASVRWLAKTACVFEYEDTSKEVEAFYTHHGVIRKNMIARGEKVPPPSVDAARNATAWENARASEAQPPADAPENMPESMPAEPPARVVHFHNAADHWNALSEEWERDDFVYIGRSSASHNLPQSPWHNPFRMVHESQRADVIQRYRDHITPLVESGELDIEALRGKTLVCWCKPKDCHGDVLVELLAAKDAARDAFLDSRDAAPTVVTTATVDPIPGVRSVGTLFTAGDWVRTHSGHVGQVVDRHGDSFIVETVNGRRPYARQHLVLTPAPEPPAPLPQLTIVRPASAYTPSAQRVIDWLTEAVTHRPIEDDASLFVGLSGKVYAGDIRALLAQVAALTLEPIP